MSGMKSTIFLIIIFTLPLCAQNFRVSVSDTTAEGKPGDEIIIGGYLVNLTSDSLTIQMIRETNDLPENWTSSLCLILCCAPWVDRTSATIPPRDSLEYSIHFNTDPVQPGRGEVRLIFQEVGAAVSMGQLYVASTSPASVLSTSKFSRDTFQLIGNYPNPFNGSTVIQFYCPEFGNMVKLRIYDLTGRIVEEQFATDVPAGLNQIHYHVPGSFASATYWYQITYVNAHGKRACAFNRFVMLK